MVEQAERALDSSGPELARMEIRLTVPRKPDAPPNAQPHEELVNIGDDAASVDNFLKRWGQVDAPLKTENVEDGGEKHTVIRVRHPLWDRSGLEVGYRNALRGAWVSDPKLLEEFAGPPPYRNAPSALIFIYEQARLYNKTRWLFANGGIQLIPDSLWSTICMLFLRDHAAHKTGFCANPECANPYFLRKRRTQKYCEAGPCVAYAQRRYSLSYWNREGRERRKNKQRKKASKSRRGQ